MIGGKKLSLGLIVGACVGSFVGTFVGISVGPNVGPNVGTFVGMSVGPNVGPNVGISVGTFVGTLVGPNVGSLVGAGVGTSVGSIVGSIDGIIDGRSEGISESQSSEILSFGSSKIGMISVELPSSSKRSSVSLYIMEALLSSPSVSQKKAPDELSSPAKGSPDAKGSLSVSPSSSCICLLTYLKALTSLLLLWFSVSAFLPDPSTSKIWKYMSVCMIPTARPILKDGVKIEEVLR